MKRLGLLGLAGAAALRRWSTRPLRLLAPFRAWTPSRLVAAPQDIRTADPTAAEDVYSGYFAFAGQIVNVHDRSPFDVEAPSEAWALMLHGMGWLRHLRAADTALARANARALVEDWIALHGPTRGGPAWNVEPTARRLMSWLAQAPLILHGADAAFRRRFLRTLARFALLLDQALREGLQGQEKLLALVAIAEFSLCGAGLDAMRRRATSRLEAEIARQILADGGHVSRNPQALIDLLLDLLPLRQLYAMRGTETPRQLFNAVDRIGPMIRLFRHAGGDLALFNGMGATRLEDVATVLAHEDARARPILNAAASGYQRLEAGDLVLVADVGRPPPMAFSSRAHAGALSFEFAAGPERIVVNCGAPASARGDLRQAARLTAAHSTLVVEDASSCGFAPDAFGAGLILAGPRQVEQRRHEEARVAGLDASHDGYQQRFNLLHRRRWRLAKDLPLLEGEDELAQARPGGRRREADFAVRFHLHPSVFAESLEDSTVAIALPGGETWIFRCEGAPASVEESIFFASALGAQASRQIVLRGRFPQTASLSWSFRLDPSAGRA